jgi:hypothetical protein
MPIIPDPDPIDAGIERARQVELRFQRFNTKSFIAWHPTDIRLIPRTAVKTGSGTKWTDGPPRPLQRFRLIPQSETTPPFALEDGTERVISFVLLGLFDAEMFVHDYWRDSMGFRYEILNVTAENGYETKGLIEKHGAV